MRPLDLSKRAARAAGTYLKAHPEEIKRAAKNVLELKVGIPVVALRWLASELAGKKLPPDFEIEARAPGIFVSGSVELMKTPLLASTTVLIERVDTSSTALLIDVRLSNLKLEVKDPSVLSPISALLQSGALDLSRPGDLLNYMPVRPALLVDARGDRFTFDLMRHPSLSKEAARKIVAALVPLVGIQAVETEGQHLDVAFSALPRGAAHVLDEFKKLW